MLFVFFPFDFIGCTAIDSFRESFFPGELRDDGLALNASCSQKDRMNQDFRQKFGGVMNITTATISDIPALCVLLESLFSQEAEFKPDHNAQARGLTAVINGSGTGDIIVARKSGEVIAMVNLLYTISTALGERVALLEDMVVAAEYRGMGVGGRLINHAVEFAQEKGCKRITLLTDNDNSGSHRFYRRHGFACSPMAAFRRLLS